MTRSIYPSILISCIFLFSNSLLAQNTSWSTTDPIGIGTTSPSEKLQVDGNILIGGWSPGVSGSGALKFIAGPTGQGAIYLTSDGKLYIDGYAGFPVSTYALEIRSSIQGPVRFQYGDLTLAREAAVDTYIRSTSQDLRLEPGTGYNTLINTASGNVGIGTTTPQAKLAVNGDIFSKKIKVTQIGWPDYVFHDGYRLITLHELEEYVKHNHHLPEVASAEKVEEEGLDIGDNQVVLLKKIEELTLYLIEQNKKLEKQEQKLTDCTSKMELQQQEIKKLKRQMDQHKQ